MQNDKLIEALADEHAVTTLQCLIGPHSDTAHRVMRDSLMSFYRATLSRSDDGAGEAVALEAYRAAVRWIAADSWDGCSECIRILQMARSLDDMDWTPDQHAAALKPLYERAGHQPISHPPADALREAFDAGFAACCAAVYVRTGQPIPEACDAEFDKAWDIHVSNNPLSEAASAHECTQECPSSPTGRHIVDCTMESGPNNCFHCERPMPPFKKRENSGAQ